MADKKIKVHNPNKFDVGVITANGIGINIKPNSFAQLTEVDIDYLQTICDLFQRRILLVDVKEQEVAETIVVPEEFKDNFLSDEEISKKLKSTAKVLTAWQADISDNIFLDRIASIAKGMDLNNSKMTVLKEKLPNYDFE